MVAFITTLAHLTVLARVTVLDGLEGIVTLVSLSDLHVIVWFVALVGLAFCGDLSGFVSEYYFRLLSVFGATRFR